MRQREHEVFVRSLHIHVCKHWCLKPTPPPSTQGLGCCGHGPCELSRPSPASQQPFITVMMECIEWAKRMWSFGFTTYSHRCNITQEAIFQSIGWHMDLNWLHLTPWPLMSNHTHYLLLLGLLLYFINIIYFCTSSCNVVTRCNICVLYK